LLPQAKVFAGDNVGELNAVLKFLRSSSTAIVLTTSAASKGVDFVFAVPQAFVVHTSLPHSMAQFKQDSGRGVRGGSIAIKGALFTDRMYFTLEDVELGLSFTEQFDKLYPIDYLQSL
jgi:superfamily II DNA helicase RecQ